ncbi:hypothetical protein FACS189485_19130 [Spirochaetia bacterium]|nr:hypothetical protein FACS189485_19130 [Spirochaetia bacterium]
MPFLKTINEFSRNVQGLAGALIMILCIAGILALAIFMIVKKINKPIAVIATALGSCILMMPIMWGLNNLVESKVGTIETTLIKRNQIREQERKINELENQIRQIESTGFNLQEFQKILELGLIETSLRQTVLDKKVFDTTHRGFIGIDVNYDWEYLGVMTNSLTAKFGVDLKKIKLYNSTDSSDTIMIYGIQAKFLGTSEYESNVEVSEVRKLILNGNSVITNIQIDNSKPAKDALRTQENLMESTYRRRLNQGLETDFMDETVEKLAENFIKMILAPLNKKIIFSNIENPDALDLSSFLEQVKAEKSMELEILKTD